jgi:multiple sugar transport system permease protein
MSGQVTGAASGEVTDGIAPVATEPILRRRNRLEVWLFLIPAALFQLLWGWYPLIVAFLISFTDAQPFQPSTFTGLDSYIRVWKDPLAWQAFRVTFVYAGMTIALTFVIPIIIAVLLMEMPSRVMRWMMLLWFLPISPIANTILWRYLYNTQYGLFQSIATSVLHLQLSQEAFLANPNQVLFWLIFPAILIFGPGLPGLIYMTGLQGIPQSYYEAAEVEGAGFWRKVWTISLPRLRPLISVMLIYGIINTMQEFSWPQIMTEGRPLGESRTVVMYMYEYMTKAQRPADATALAVFLFLAVMVIVILARVIVREDPDA